MDKPSFQKKDEDNIVSLPFQSVDKMKAIQEAKAAFNDTPLKSRKCIYAITQMLYILGQGENLSTNAATDLFFGSTKLFVSEDPKLRRMLYLFIKELSNHAEQTFVACNSLFKDTTSKNEEFKANAIRALRKVITEASMFGQLERHLKQAVVDQSPSIASAALLSGLHLAENNMEMVKRWAGEVQSTLKTNYFMVQYHSLALWYLLRRSDPLAVAKLVTTNISTFRSPLAHTMLIRYGTKVLKEEGNLNSERSKGILKYFDSCLSHKSDMIVLEAAKAICNLPGVTTKELTTAVIALQSFLTSSKPVNKFSAIRLLNQLANTHPTIVSLSNSDMEHLITNSNRNVATLAITTLLKTGNESNIDKLMKQINTFMSDIPDEFKIVVVEAMRALCFKYPQKHYSMLQFLSSALREEGGYDYKKSIVDTIITVLEKIPDAKEHGITQLCEFIEDCEFTLLLQQVLHFLGNEGPKSQNPNKCIRYIYNRVLLESASVRAAAVYSLAKFAAMVPALRPSILVILKRTTQDNDDEVRDRAVFYLRILQSGDESLIKNYIIDDLVVHIGNLESALTQYLATAANKGIDAFDISKVPTSVAEATPPASSNDTDEEEEEHVLTTKKAYAGQKQQQLQAKGDSSASLSSSALVAAPLRTVPQIANLGVPLKSSKPTKLSEIDGDYVVNCFKHIFKDHIVFQFQCTNKVESQLLRDVTVEMDISALSQGLSNEFIEVRATRLPYDCTESVYLSFARDPNSLSLGKVSNTLKFKASEVDTETGESLDDADEDEFALEDIKLTIGDYLCDQQQQHQANFKESWEQWKEQETMGQIKNAGVKDAQSAIDKFIEKSGLSAINDKKVPPKKNQHTVYLAGGLPTGETALVIAQVTVEESGSTVKVAVRAESSNLAKGVLDFLTSTK